MFNYGLFSHTFSQGQTKSGEVIKFSIMYLLRNMICIAVSYYKLYFGWQLSGVCVRARKSSKFVLTFSFASIYSKISGLEFF